MCAFTTLHRTDYKYDKVHMYITTLRMWTLIHRLDNISILRMYKCSSHPGCKRVASWLNPRTTKFSLQHLHNNIDLHNRQREQAVSSQTNTGVDRCRQVTPHTAAALCVCIANTCADRQAGTCMHAQNVHQLW